MKIPARILKIIPTALAGAAAFTLSTETAYAFFPPLPTGGDGITVTPPPGGSILPVNPIIPVLPPPSVAPITPPPFVPPPVVNPIVPPPVVPPPLPPDPPVDPGGGDDCNHPAATPEPATVVSGLLGLSVLGGVRWMRRRVKGESQTER